MAIFTNYVGVAPSTTTITINGCASCVQGQRTQMIFNPYATESRLTGLRGAALRWDILALALGVGFAATLGVAAWSERKRSR